MIAYRTCTKRAQHTTEHTTPRDVVEDALYKVKVRLALASTHGASHSTEKSPLLAQRPQRQVMRRPARGPTAERRVRESVG